MTEKHSTSLLRILPEFAVPLTATALMIFGSSFYTTFLSIFLDSEGYSNTEIGMIHAAFFSGMFLGAFQMETWIKRIGYIQSLAVFGSLATSATLLQALFPIFPLWVFLRFLFGTSLAALYIVIESWMLHHSHAKTRGVVLSTYYICLYGSQAISQQMLALVDIHTLTPFLVSALFTALSIIPVGLSTSRKSPPITYETLPFSKIIRVSPFGVSGCFASGLIISALFSFFPLLAVSEGIPSQNLMSLTIIGGVLLQWPLGRLSDLFERRRTLLTIIGLTFALALYSYLYQGTSMEVMLTLTFFMGGFAFALYPVSITQVCDHLDAVHITRATAFLLIAYGAGSVCGPIASSVVIDFYGEQAIFLYIALIAAALGCVGLITTLQRPIIPLDEQNAFVPMPNVTPIASEMDPRGED